MYLKSLEMVGFKSFIDKTRLDFGPGMTAIVGPNGCGKSNISDALRWVLGEQSAKALRGSKMEDCIFNGTDARKPTGMAEVNITFSDCENMLDTEYNEVTVTRRVFRSGEGHYFINKTPCRLKDVQRLFMDTGIGTTSYSFMEQGRIDQVLSSRPEDRRAIFEEASGITKFKADKKEAIRKLEHTEANLLRLADVIREVKRQIGSLQRQAGKARRYKELRAELRKLDIFATKSHVEEADKNIKRIEAEIADLSGKLDAANRDIRELENGRAALHESYIRTEREIGTVLEAGVHAQSTLSHTRELIHTNKQRIQEYKGWSERDSREIDETRKQIEERWRFLDELSRNLEKARAEKEHAASLLKEANDKFQKHHQRTDSIRSLVQKLREESVEFESLASRSQNQLVEIDSRERSTVIQRERLAAEQAQLARTTMTYEKRRATVAQALENMQRDVACREENIKKSRDERKDKAEKLAALQRACAALQLETATQKARMELLREDDESGQDFPVGARLLLDKSDSLNMDKTKLLGALTSCLDVEPAFATALEAVLHARLDAVLVADPATAFEALCRLESRGKSPARILAVESSRANNSRAADHNRDKSRLLNHVKCPPNIMPALERLIGNVIVADSIESLPRDIPAGMVYVTMNGIVAGGDGFFEVWAPDSPASTPLARKHALAVAMETLPNAEARIVAEKAAITNLLAEIEAIEKAIAETQAGLDESKRTAAQKEGENQVVEREAAESHDRLDTVTWELNNLDAQGASGDQERKGIARKLEEISEQRRQITAEIAERSHELKELEQRHAELQSEITEHRVMFAAISERVAHLDTQHEGLKTRLNELDTTLKSRAQVILSYETGIENLAHDILTAEARLGSLDEAVKTNNERADSLRRNRGKQAEELKEMEKALTENRAMLEEIRDAKSRIELRCAESKMQRQNQIERIISEYAVGLDQMMQEPEPEWEDGRPTIDGIETSIAEIRTKIEAMGPVNLVAIEEHKELEERYTFLTEQENDLIQSKQQLMEMIRKINRTTSEMFQTTFAHVNENFNAMFKTLFNGGSAKLVLVNEEDVLECGIEIIARPPGKRLQNVTLLSGGERTLTAVALLFSIYMIRPSPFCLLDELDAALDDSNIGRFVRTLKNFLSQSQFAVITHNRQTIAAADVLYGITMPEKGISKIVSVKFNDKAKETLPAPAPAVSPAPDSPDSGVKPEISETSNIEHATSNIEGN